MISKQSLTSGDLYSGAIGAALVGGTAFKLSGLSGGKFMSGAQTSVFAYLFNESSQKGKSFPNGITKEQAAALLRKDVEWAAKAVEKLVTIDLTQYQEDALISLVYNIGEPQIRK